MSCVQVGRNMRCVIQTCSMITSISLTVSSQAGVQYMFEHAECYTCLEHAACYTRCVDAAYAIRVGVHAACYTCWVHAACYPCWEHATCYRNVFGSYCVPGLILCVLFVSVSIQLSYTGYSVIVYRVFIYLHSVSIYRFLITVYRSFNYYYYYQ